MGGIAESGGWRSGSFVNGRVGSDDIPRAMYYAAITAGCRGICRLRAHARVLKTFHGHDDFYIYTQVRSNNDVRSINSWLCFRQRRLNAQDYGLYL